MPSVHLKNGNDSVAGDKAFDFSGAESFLTLDPRVWGCLHPVKHEMTQIGSWLLFLVLFLFFNSRSHRLKHEFVLGINSWNVCAGFRWLETQ